MNYQSIAFWIMILSIIGLSIYLLFYIKSESYECMSNPLVYGVRTFRVQMGEFTCLCSAPNSRQVFVDKNNATLLDSVSPLSSKF